MIVNNKLVMKRFEKKLHLNYFTKSNYPEVLLDFARRN